MSNSANIEDLFQKFSLHVLFSGGISPHDSTIIDSFSNVIASGNKLTSAQAKLMLRLLKKYHDIVKLVDKDAESLVKNPIWKQDFRVLDLTKKVFVEKTEDGLYDVGLKFPYSFKSEFETYCPMFLSKYPNYRWDSQRKVTWIPFYELNILVLYDYLITNDFEIDDSFLSAVALVEEIWENQEKLVPMVKIIGEKVEIFNVSDDAKNYWDQQVSGEQNKDLLLARTMGIRLNLNKKFKNIFEKIASSEDATSFWCKNVENFFAVYKELDGVAAIILDRNSDILEWTKRFVAIAENCQIPRSDIKICFRDSEKDSDINRWIKDNQLGGTVEHGKIFIFNHKPAKWLFTKDINVKLVGTNSLFPFSQITTQRWLDSFPLMFYIGEIRASTLKESKIVEL